MRGSKYRAHEADGSSENQSELNSIMSNDRLDEESPDLNIMPVRPLMDIGTQGKSLSTPAMLFQSPASLNSGLNSAKTLTR